MAVCQAWLWYEHNTDMEATESIAPLWNDEVHIAVDMKMSLKKLYSNTKVLKRVEDELVKGDGLVKATSDKEKLDKWLSTL